MLQKTYYFGKKRARFQTKAQKYLKVYFIPNGRSLLYPAGGLPDNPKELSEI